MRDSFRLIYLVPIVIILGIFFFSPSETVERQRFLHQGG